MAATYEPIATANGTGSSNTVSFSSISGTYTDLRVVANLQLSTGGVYPYFRVGNGTVDSGNNYGATVLYGNGTSAASLRGSNFSQPDFLYPCPTSNFQLVTMDFLNYSNTTTYKTIIYRMAESAQGTSAHVVNWRSTSAINIISFIAPSGNWTTGSTFTLYGIASA
jgi:hypothetical protein